MEQAARSFLYENAQSFLSENVAKRFLISRTGAARELVACVDTIALLLNDVVS